MERGGGSRRAKVLSGADHFARFRCYQFRARRKALSQRGVGGYVERMRPAARCLLLSTSLLARSLTSGPAARALSAPDSTWLDHQRASAAAYAAGDWTAFKYHLLRVGERLGNHPALLLALARADARLGDGGAALEKLRSYAAMGLGRDISDDSSFMSLHGSAAWTAVMEQLRRNLEPVGGSTVAFALPDSDFVAEDLTWDGPGKRFIVSSMRHRKLVAVSPDGAATAFAPVGGDRVWAILGVAMDRARGALWATTEAVPFALGVLPADSGRSAVLRFDLANGRLLKRYPLPTGAGHEPGDLAVLPNGDVFVSDGRAGVIYVVRAGADALETLVPPGTFISPQGPALALDGSRILVADYALGLASVDRATGRVEWLPAPADIALTGIDGLLLDGTSLIGIQNGVTPNRIIRVNLDAAQRRVTAVTVIAQDTSLFDEPTHGVLVDGVLYVIANSGAGRFGPDGLPIKGARIVAPRIVRIPLAGEPADTTATKAALLAADAALSQAVQARGAAAVLDVLESGAAVLIPGQCTVGFSRFINAADSSGTERRGAYETCWRRGADGQWRIVAHLRQDTPRRDAARESGETLPHAPHSATVSRSRDPRTETQDRDTEFAKTAMDSGTGLAFAKYAAPDVVNLAFMTYGPGPFLTIWRENPDGSWSYIFDLGSPRP